MASSEVDGSTNVITSSSLVDRISELPESLLVQILSLLPTKDAFKTCILSKRWRYLWTFIHNFRLRCRNVDNVQSFVTFVDYVLAHSVSSKINKFELFYVNLYEYTSQISRWLTFAAEKNVEHVFIWSVHENPTCTLPQSFRTCSSLTTLGLVNFPFDYDGVIQWKSLTNLNLTYLLISDNGMGNLLSGCPALEIMELCVFKGFSRLQINSLKMKTLKLGAYSWDNDGRDHSLEIVAPNLQHLEIAGGLYDLKCRLVDVSSVVNAKLTFTIMCIKDIWGEEFADDSDDEDSCHDYHQVFRTLVQDYIQKWSFATELTIGSWFTKVLCMLQFKVEPIPELKCRHLKLLMHMEKFNLYGVAGLLRASPHVEILNIDIAPMLPDKSLCNFESRYLAKGDDNIDLQSWISTLVLPNLNKVEIVISIEVFSWGLSGVLCLKEHSNWGFNKLFELSEFLLKAATILENFVIISKRTECRTCKTCSTNCVSLYLSRLTEKLRGFPRSSTNSVIIFRDSRLP